MNRKTGKAASPARADRQDAAASDAPEIPDLPPRLILDMRAACNLKCPMCPLHGPQGDNFRADLVGEMSREQAGKILDEVMAAKPLIQPQMYGEPLLAHGLQERLLDIKERGMAVAMNSNGLTLTDAMARFFVENRIDAIFFSVDAVTSETLEKVRGIDKLEKVENAVHRMLRIRGDAEYPRIGVSFTTQDANEAELEAFIEKWTPVVDCVRIGKVFENGQVRGLTVPEKRTPCPALYLTMTVHNDGTVSACCMDAFRETNMGNVFKDGVRGVWHGPELTRMRHLHETGRTDEIPFCKNCNRWPSYQYKEEVKGGLLIRESPEFTYYNRIDRLANWKGSLLGGHRVEPLAE